MRTVRVRTLFSGPGERTSGVKPRLSAVIFGTAEAVPFAKRLERGTSTHHATQKRASAMGHPEL